MPPRPLLRLRARVFSAAEPLVRVSHLPVAAGHIRVLELNRPAARNALSRALLAALRAEVAAVHAQHRPAPAPGEHGPARALVLASAVDACFCAGADLKERRGFTPDETADFLAALRGTLADLAALPVPSIAAVASLALGGGLELALAAHLRVLTSNAAVGLPETRLVIIPGAGGTHRLPALIGLPRARDLILTGRRVAAPETYLLGLTDRLVDVVPEPGASDADTLQAARKATLAEAVRLAREICGGGPIAISAALQAVAAPSPENEGQMYERVVNTEDRNEALKAFHEKRKPIFKGR